MIAQDSWFIVSRTTSCCLLRLWREKTSPGVQGGLSLRLKCTWLMMRIRQQDLAASTKSAVRLSAEFPWRRSGVASIELSRRGALPRHTCVEVTLHCHRRRAIMLSSADRATSKDKYSLNSTSVIHKRSGMSFEHIEKMP